MIILEGPDGVGKTRAAKLMCELHGMNYVHMGPPSHGGFDHVNWYLEEAADNWSSVRDRFHLGEWVYGKMLGKSRHGEFVQRWKVHTTLKELGCLVIVMFASDPDDLILHDDDSPTDARKANHGFSNLARVLSCRRVDISEDGYPNSNTMQGWFDVWHKRVRR